MAVLMMTQLPIGRSDIEALSASMNVRNDPPPGLIIHTAYEEGGAVKVVDVWESEDAFREFAGGRLAQALQRFAADRGLQLPEGGPDYTFQQAFDVVQGGR